MYTKVAPMVDKSTADEIIQVSTPSSCNELVRQVKIFDDDIWHRHLNDIAFEVVKLKLQASVQDDKMVDEVIGSLRAEVPAQRGRRQAGRQAGTEKD